MTQRALRNLASVALAAIAVFSLAPAASGAVATKLPVGATAALDSVPPKDWALQQTAPILEQVLAKTTLAELGGTALAGDVRGADPGGLRPIFWSAGRTAWARATTCRGRDAARLDRAVLASEITSCDLCCLVDRRRCVSEALEAA